MLAYRLCCSMWECTAEHIHSYSAVYRPLAATSKFLQQSSVLVSIIFSGCFSALTW